MYPSVLAENKDVEGKKNYELSNHLGNVLAVISDRKKGSGNVGGNYAYFDAVTISATDYYPFGMAMPGRTFNTEGYRYGFNGQERDTELGNSFFTAEYWEYDARIGRRWNRDPVVLAWQSPYAALDNNPIALSDPSGASTQDPVKETDPTYDPKKDTKSIVLEEIIVKDKKPLDRKKYPIASNFERSLRNSYDVTMGMSNNQFINPYKTSQQRQSDLVYASRLGETSEEITKAWLMALAAPLQEFVLAEMLFAGAAGEYMLLYHGTTSKAANSILSNGFKMGARTTADFGDGVYLTESLSTARYAALRHEGSEIISVAVPISKLSKLKTLTFETADMSWSNFARSFKTGLRTTHPFDIVKGPFYGRYSERLGIALSNGNHLQISFNTVKSLNLLNQSLLYTTNPYIGRLSIGIYLSEKTLMGIQNK